MTIYKTNLFPLFLTVLFISLTAVYSCGPSERAENGISETSIPERVRVRLPADPERLNPMLSRSGYAAQIESNIFMYLLDHDPETLEFVPILAEDEPEVEDGRIFDGEQTTAYTFTIREEAEWSDGRPVLGSDYLFTLKAALNPHVPSSSWRGFLQFIRDVEIDENNPRVFTVYVDSEYMHSMEVAAGLFVYPEHIYDPRQLMQNFEYSQLRNAGEVEFTEREESALVEFGERFTAARYSSDVVEGSGPYKLVSYEAGQRISLERKSNWWGEDIFRPGPDRIDYLIIADEAVALSGLKDGSIDIASELPPRYFRELQEDKTHAAQFDFYTPPLFQIYYLALNNMDPILSEIEVRRALAHLIDLDFVIEELMGGFAVPAPTVIHPAKEKFNDALSPLEYSIEKADSLLAEAGWLDTDGDGIRDRATETGIQDLSLTIDVSAGETGQQLALLLKESGEKMGIDFNIRTREFRLIREDIRNRNYQITPLVIRQSLMQSDLHQNWHTDSRAPDGNNLSLYSNPRADSLMEMIRIEKDPEILRSLYMEVQEVIYRDQAVIFLVAPTERVVVNNRLKLITSAKRPGYFEGMALLKDPL